MNSAPRAAIPDPVGDVLALLAGRVASAVVIDVGGGSGTRSVPLARLGCRVLVVDSSIDALAILTRRATDAGVADRISGIQADAASLADVVQAGAADLILCHHLLETVDDPSAVLTGIAGALKPGGVTSVLVAGRFAAVLAQAARGRFGEAAAILEDPDGRFGPQDPLRRRFDLAGISRLLAESGLEVESTNGIGVVSSLLPGSLRSGARPGTVRSESVPLESSRSAGQLDEVRLAELESELSAHVQLREIAADLHAVARRRVG